MPKKTIVLDEEGEEVNTEPTLEEFAETLVEGISYLAGMVINKMQGMDLSSERYFLGEAYTDLQSSMNWMARLLGT